jgi:predicted transport protein
MSISRAAHIERALGDPKLFRVGGHATFELSTSDQLVESSIQHIFEHNLDQLLGVRFIASNHAIEPGGEAVIETLALDPEGRPVIIAYASSTEDSVVNRGLYALDWLTAHRSDVQWLVQQRLGGEYRQVNWFAPRLICLAADFNRYDTHAANQIQRNIELLRYRRFEGDFIMIELVHTQNILQTTRTIIELPSPATPWNSAHTQTVAEPDEVYTIQRKIAVSTGPLRGLFDATSRFLHDLGSDVSLRELKYYHAYRRVQNFACLDLYPAKAKLKVLVRVNPDDVELEPGFTRDVRRVTHFGTGDLEITLRNRADLERAAPIFQRSYDETLFA